jgi:putative ABC transport system permease protein
MIRNYLKIAIRNLKKYPFISFINLFGLSVGIACCLLILAYLLNELSFDRYHERANNIYRVERTFLNPDTKAVNLELGTIAPPFGPLLQNDFPEIKKITRLLPNGNNTAFRYEEKRFNERDVYFADEHLFDVFDVPLVKGNPKKALNDPFTVLLSEEVARKYFGKEDPMNKVVRLNNQNDVKVTGVYRDFPGESHIRPRVMISFNTLKDTSIYGEERLRTNWGNNSFFTYLLMPDGFDHKKMEAAFPAFLNRHIKHGGTVPASEWNRLAMRKLTDIHLYAHTDFEARENGDIKRIYIFSAIALFILLIACINYMNLSTARSVLRAREIGVRKTVGAGKAELMGQFLSESVLISWIAMLLAFILAWIAMPWLNKLSGQDLKIEDLLQLKIIIPLLLVPFVVGLVSGFYPALFLASFKPVKVLKGVLKVGSGSLSMRKAMVVFQFAISIILIVCTVIVFEQLRYMQKKDLGFDREHIVTMNYTAGLADNYDAFRNELLASGSIKDVGRSSRIPTGRLLDASGTQIRRGDTMAPANAEIKNVRADFGFISTYGIKMVAGRNFLKENGLRDTSAFLINEAAVKALGLASPEDAVGKEFQYGNRKGELVGVYKDFHFESMHEKILPIALFMPVNQNSYGLLSLKIAGNNLSGALEHMEKVWKKFLPETPFDYTFMDENFERLYEAEQKQATIFTVFAFIAIFIACLGLFGLSAFTISQRIKEIGIRKVLGADISSIVGLLSKDFLKLVLVAAVLAFPVAWYAMSRWLEDFAYRTQIPWWSFVFAGVIASVIAFLTISFQAVKAAMANPVRNLRTE